MTPNTLIIGTNNPVKRLALRSILGQYCPGAKAVDLTEFQPAQNTDCDRNISFYDNAWQKAFRIANQLGECVLADDTGLVVPILGGRPGLKSHCYASTQELSVDKLLHEMHGFEHHERGCAYVCCLALANPSTGLVEVQEAVHHSRLVREPQGTYGFGYERIIEVSGTRYTFGEVEFSYELANGPLYMAFMRLRPTIEQALNL